MKRLAKYSTFFTTTYVQQCFQIDIILGQLLYQLKLLIRKQSSSVTQEGPLEVVHLI